MSQHSLIRSPVFAKCVVACALGYLQLAGTAPLFAATPDLPLLNISQLEYLGAFRLPASTYGTSSVLNSTGPIGYNPKRNSLFVSGKITQHSIAEFAIPKLTNSLKIGDLSIASAPIQSFSDVLHKAPIEYDIDIAVAGLQPVGDKLLLNVYEFYDQDYANPYNTLVINDGANVKSSSVNGYFRMSGEAMAAGWMSPIPAEWQSSLGGTYISGFSKSTNRANRYSSYGPSAYAFNAEDVANNSGSISGISTIPLIYYTLENGLVSESDLLNQSGTNSLWTSISEASYGLIIPGTSTYLVLGMSGGHESGVSYGVPPYGGYKGYYTNDQHDQHCYYWLYNLNDVVKVKAGQIKPYAVKPYETGVFAAPFQVDNVNKISGGTFDSANGIIYLTIAGADHLQDSSLYSPVIVAYRFNVARQSPPAPPGNISVGTK